MNAIVHPNVSELVGSYRKHRLEDLNDSVLMNRVDTKYLLHIELLPYLLSELQPNFSLLEINGNSVFKYRSTYYDTDSLDFYHMHHRGKLNRYKVRIREYLDVETKFLEVKFKNNKKRTIKTRRQIFQNKGNPIEDFSDFLRGTGLPDLNIRQKQISEYYRLALASEERKERVTLDLNLANVFKGDNESYRSSINDLVVMEVKQQELNRNSPVFSLLKKFGLRSSGFSKYCMGMVYTNNSSVSLKSNRFKHICRRVDNIKLLA